MAFSSVGSLVPFRVFAISGFRDLYFEPTGTGAGCGAFAASSSWMQIIMHLLFQVTAQQPLAE